MSLKFLFGVVTYVAVCASIFATFHSGIGTAIVLVTVLQLAYLIAVGKTKESAKAFWSGLLALAWFAFILGFVWEVKSDRRAATAGGSPHPAARIWTQFVTTIYFPITRSVEPQGSIMEFRSVMDGGFKNYGVRTVPSMVNFSRLIASLSAWLVAGCTAMVISCVGQGRRGS